MAFKICFNLDQSKIMSSGNGLNVFAMVTKIPEDPVQPKPRTPVEQDKEHPSEWFTSGFSIHVHSALIRVQYCILKIM